MFWSSNLISLPACQGLLAGASRNHGTRALYLDTQHQSSSGCWHTAFVPAPTRQRLESNGNSDGHHDALSPDRMLSSPRFNYRAVFVAYRPWSRTVKTILLMMLWGLLTFAAPGAPLPAAPLVPSWRLGSGDTRSTASVGGPVRAGLCSTSRHGVIWG